VTNQQLERRVEFTLKQHADFWAGMTRLERETERSRADTGRLTVEMGALTAKLDTVTDLVGRSAHAATILVEPIDRLSDGTAK